MTTATTTPTTAELLARFDAWETHRAELCAQEEDGGPPASAWESSDDEGCELARILAAALRPATVERQPFPVDTFDGACPSCQHLDSVQSLDEPTRYWGSAEVRDGVLTFDGHYDVTDEGANERIGCWNCGTEWELPAEVDYL